MPTSQPSNSTAPYESQLVAHFHRQLGRAETEQHFNVAAWLKVKKMMPELREKGITKEEREQTQRDFVDLIDASLNFESDEALNVLSNAQNPLDHLVGDLLAETPKGRYFIIEFKRYPTGFVDEASWGHGAKIDRVALIAHLQMDERCKALSLQGHFGAYWSNFALRFACYYPLARGENDSDKSTSDLFCIPDHAAHWWSSDELREYLTCMSSHGSEFVNDGGVVVFGYIDKDGQVVTMVESAKIFKMIQVALAQAAALRPARYLGADDGQRQGPRSGHKRQ